MNRTFPLAAALFLAAPSFAQDLGPAYKTMDEYFLTGALNEQLVHARRIPLDKELGGVTDSKTLAGYIPECDDAGALDLPPKYVKEYEISPEDKDKLLRILGAGQKYSDIKKALADGYAPVDEFEDGLGMALAKVSLFTDRKYYFDKPDLLFYIKDRNKMAFRIVSVAYVAGERLPSRDFKITRKKSKGLIKLWRPWDDICFKSVKGALTYRDSDDKGGGSCAGGRFIKKAFIMNVWLPLYNPGGLFTPRNPIAEHFDLTGKPFSFCRKKI